MLQASLAIDETVTPAEALARGYALWDAVSAAEPLALYGAVLEGEALILGAYQRAHDALSDEARAHDTVLRRRSGGVTLRAGQGVLYAAVGLHDRSTLMSCPLNRILNRNVRGALAGLRKAGLAAHYFGRDFISVDTRPAVFVGWDARPDGRVLLELFVAESASYLPGADVIAYPPRIDDPFRGKALLTLQQAGARARGPALLERLAQGYGEMAQVTWRSQAAEITHAVEQVSAAEHADDLTWSRPREEAIGFVSAGVALDASSKLHEVRLAGDFFQDQGCPSALQRALLGVEPSAETIGRALDTVYARSGHELEGVRSLETFREAILDAVASARAGT